MARAKKSSNFKAMLLLAGIAVGVILGLAFKEKVLVIKPLGDIFLNLMFTVVVPLVFVSIAMAVGNMLNLKRLGRILGSTVLCFIVTGLIAASFILIAVKVFPPAQGTNIALKAEEMSESKTAAELIVGSLTVSDFAGLMSRKNMLPIIVFSIIFGLAVSMNGGQESPVGKLLNNLNAILMKIVDLIMLYAPIGLGAYFAALIGEFGPNLIKDYGRALLIYCPVIAIYMLIMFPAYAYWAGGKSGLKRMLKNIFSPMITAFGTQSSIATIPANKLACKNIGVPEDISDIVLPMGATMHMDGSVISGILKISFLFGVFGQPFQGFGTIAMSIVVAIMSAFVLSGVAGGGLVGEMLIVSLFGFPPEAFPIIAMIGFLIDAPATMANASGDTITSMMVARLVEGKNWLKKQTNLEA